MRRFLCLAVLGLLTSLNLAFADFSVKLKNCYNKTLHVQLGYNPQLLPSFQQNFPIPKQQNRSSSFQPPAILSTKNTEVYLSISPSGESKTAFFGVEYIPNGQGSIRANGYISNGIAYSWTSGNNITVTFCRPQDYQDGACSSC